MADQLAVCFYVCGRAKLWLFAGLLTCRVITAAGVQRAEHLVRGGAGAERQGSQGGSRGFPALALGETRWQTAQVGWCCSTYLCTSSTISPVRESPLGCPLSTTWWLGFVFRLAMSSTYQCRPPSHSRVSAGFRAFWPIAEYLCRILRFFALYADPSWPFCFSVYSYPLYNGIG